MGWGGMAVGHLFGDVCGGPLGVGSNVVKSVDDSYVNSHCKKKRAMTDERDESWRLETWGILLAHLGGKEKRNQKQEMIEEIALPPNFFYMHTQTHSTAQRSTAHTWQEGMGEKRTRHMHECICNHVGEETTRKLDFDMCECEYGAAVANPNARSLRRRTAYRTKDP
ncbi:hypothetical protein M0802_004380 [Mischocyttarus mexicanus]|nr:hypothetical protein M0802_004380 [Mischocyttarus mexicanus]